MNLVESAESEQKSIGKESSHLLPFSYTIDLLLHSETVKTRMQVSGGGLGSTISGIASNEGFGAFWKGILFAYGRELSYTAIKLGAYAPVRDALGAGKDSPVFLKFIAGAITGGIGSFIGNPFGTFYDSSKSTGYGAN